VLRSPRRGSLPKRCRSAVEALPRPSCLGTRPAINGECRPFGRHSFGALWLPNYSRRDATALRSKLLLSMWNITSSFLKDSEGMKRRTALTLPVSHKQNRMSIGGFPVIAPRYTSTSPRLPRGNLSGTPTLYTCPAVSHDLPSKSRAGTRGTNGGGRCQGG